MSSVGAIVASSGLSLPSTRVIPRAAPDAARTRETSTPLLELFVDALLEAVRSLQVSTRLRHKGIHSARKAMRRARSILQVARADLGPEGDTCDYAIKGICRDLSAARDAQAQLDAFDRLAEKGRLTVAPETQSRARQFLVRRRARIVHGLLAKDPDFRTLRARLTEALEAAKRLDWNSVRLEDTTSAMARSVRRALKISQRARMSEREQVRHRWRRRMRRSVQQRAVLASLGNPSGGAGQADGMEPAITTESAAQAFADLVRLLGLEHDLRVLHATFESAGSFCADERAALCAAIEAEMLRIARKCARQADADNTAALPEPAG